MRKRDYKESGEGLMCHVFNRGNNKEKIFLDQQDYKAFLFRLGLALGVEEKILNSDPILSIPYSRIRVGANKGLFKLHAFCLMPNHFHLLIEQCGDTEISKIISQVCTSYAMYLNKKYKRVGHVFQERFKSVPIEDNSHLMYISSYIHMNPVKDKMTKNPKDYIWSSFKDYTNERKLPIVSTELIGSLFGNDFIKETLSISREDEP